MCISYTWASAPTRLETVRWLQKVRRLEKVRQLQKCTDLKKCADLNLKEVRQLDKMCRIQKVYHLPKMRPFERVLVFMYLQPTWIPRRCLQSNRQQSRTVCTPPHWTLPYNPRNGPELSFTKKSDLKCKRDSVGQIQDLSIPRSSVRFHVKAENSNSHAFERH